MVGDEVTLDYVASKAGVSRAAASRALNDRPGVADDVRDRVKTIAESLNYRPNRAAQNLAGGRTRVVGLVLGGNELQTDIYAASLTQAVAKAADSFDEGLMLLLAGQEPGRAVQNLLRDGLVDGVIVTALAMYEPWVEELMQTKLPKVILGSRPVGVTAPFVGVENCESSALIVEHLLDTGCQHVGIVTGPLDRLDSQLRLKGYRLAHERRNLAIDDALVVEGTFQRESGYVQGNILLERGVDAVFARNDERALGVLRAATERGIACPADLSVAGFDGTSFLDQLGIDVTTLVQPFDELGMTAMGMLVDLLCGKELADSGISVAPTVRFGSTTRPAS